MTATAAFPLFKERNLTVRSGSILGRSSRLFFY